jgi:hypothetical protein
MADGIVQPSAALKAMEREYKSKADDTASMFEVLMTSSYCDNELTLPESLETPRRERRRT